MSDLSSRVLVHGTSILLAAAAAPFDGPEDSAVLLLGDSGSGKSDLALRLIATGARLIADDQTALFVRNGRLFAGAPARTRGLLEVRGVGIVPVDAAGEAPLILVVDLRTDGIARMPEPEFYTPPPPLSASPAPVLVAVNPFEASAPAKIAAAAAMAAKGEASAATEVKNKP
jgi:hypothetical protein